MHTYVNRIAILALLLAPAGYANDDLASAYASSATCLDFALAVEPGGSTCIVAVFDISDQSSFYILGLFGANERILLDVP